MPQMAGFPSLPCCWKALQALDQDTEKKQEEAQVPAQDSCEVYGAYVYIYIYIHMYTCYIHLVSVYVYIYIHIDEVFAPTYSTLFVVE